MRNLTILREKSFVGGLGKLQVYIEDPISQELTIQGVPCRKLGSLSNGQQQTFQIDDTRARVYVIADKLSKNFTNEFYELPAGTEDVFLSGKNHYNPFAGNPFYFNGNTNEASLQNRKQSKKKALLICAISLVLGLAIGFLIISIKNATKPQDFTEAGMTITLSDEFHSFTAQGYTFAYTTAESAVFGLKEPFSIAPGVENMTLEEYGQLVIANSNLEGKAQLTQGDGFMHFEFQVDSFYYLACVYKGNDAFWLVQFSCDTDNKDTYKSQFLDWAKTVTFE